MIIGIAGKKRAGKDTIAREFIKRGFVHDSFAAPIRRFVADLIGYEITDENKELPIAWAPHLTPRLLMQTVGTEWGRSLDPDLWVLSFMYRKQPLGLNVVVHDVRFENEASAIRNAGGLMIHVQRNIVHDDNHASEAGVGVRFDLGDLLIRNNESIEGLIDRAAAIADYAASPMRSKWRALERAS